MEFLEHILLPDLPDVIAKLHRLLDNQGLFVVNVPSKNVPVKRKYPG
jgi:predicted SAM-dependent methyltransferase